MPASEQFKVHSLLVSEYATQDGEGKPILVGLQTGTAHFQEPPPVLPPWYLTAILQPLVPIFSCELSLSAPNGKHILRINFDHTADIVGDAAYRLVLNVQLPTIRFPGEGVYNIRIRGEDGDTVFRQPLEFKIGKPQNPRANVEANAQINPEFTIGKTANIKS